MKAKLLTSLISATLLTACGSTPMTPEEQAMASQMQQAFLARLQSSTMPGGAATQAQETVEPEIVISENELLAQKQKIDLSGGPAIFYREKDGIL